MMDPLSDSLDSNIQQHLEWANMNNNQKLLTLVRKIQLREIGKYCCARKDNSDFTNFVNGSVSDIVEFFCDGNLENGMSVPELINFSGDTFNKLSCYRKLFSSLKSIDSICSLNGLTLLYFIKQEMNQLSDNLELLAAYLKMKLEFPKNFQAVIFSETVTIRHRHFNEYMSESMHTETKNRRTIFCWKKPGNPVLGGNFYFEPGMRNGKLFFYIRNDCNEKGSYVTQSSCYWSIWNMYRGWSRCKVVGDACFNSGTELMWSLEPRGKCFKIKTWNGKYLYAPHKYFSLDNERRFVFIWKSKEHLINEKTDWVIEKTNAL